MTVLIVSSTRDPASINIKQHLLINDEWDEIELFNKNPVFRNKNMKDVIIVTINDNKINHENIDMEIKEELGINPKEVIFISRHTSKTGSPTLTVHPIGNYGKAEYGGKDRELIQTSPKLMTQLLRVLKKTAEQTKLYHKVCFEVTHHGPYLKVPTLFIEVGSNMEEWTKQKPAEVVAKSILELLKSYHYEKDLPKEIPVLLGIGGGHYAPRFTDVILEKQSAFGHMIPTYQINNGNIDEDIIEKAINTTPNLEAVYLHRKFLKKSQRTYYKNWFKERNIPVISSKELIPL